MPTKIIIELPKLLAPPTLLNGGGETLREKLIKLFISIKFKLWEGTGEHGVKKPANPKNDEQGKRACCGLSSTTP